MWVPLRSLNSRAGCPLRVFSLLPILLPGACQIPFPSPLPWRLWGQLLTASHCVLPTVASFSSWVWPLWVRPLFSLFFPLWLFLCGCLVYWSFLFRFQKGRWTTVRLPRDVWCCRQSGSPPHRVLEWLHLSRPSSLDWFIFLAHFFSPSFLPFKQILLGL